MDTPTVVSVALLVGLAARAVLNRRKPATVAQRQLGRAIQGPRLAPVVDIRSARRRRAG
jgi:hypothetical protein